MISGCHNTSCESYSAFFPVYFWVVFNQPVMSQKHVYSIEIHYCLLDVFLSPIRYSLVVILELNGVSEVQYKGVMMIDDGKYQ